MRLLILAMLGVVACGDEPVLLKSIDLVTGGMLQVDGKRLAAHETFFAEETWVAVPVMSGLQVKADFELHREPFLELAGAVTCRDSEAALEDGSLLVELGFENSTHLRQTISVHPSLGWWKQRVDLAVTGRKTGDTRSRGEFARGLRPPVARGNNSSAGAV